MKKTFKEFVIFKEEEGSKDWKQESLAPPLPKGFIPPTKLRPVINAFLNSGKVILQRDTSGKDITMPHKTLYLVGGPVRDFIKGKSVKDLDLATNATPAQIATILAAAGFKRTGDRSGKNGEELKLPSTFVDAEGREVGVEDAKQGDNRLWFIKGRDNSQDRKPFVISAVVDGEEFEIATFRKDAKVVDGQATVDFVDNPKDDAARRDLTINALYIELTKADGENKKLYDPTGHGLYDLKNGTVRAVGKAEERFEEDPLRILRAIRFHCRFGQGDTLDEDIKKAIPKFLANLPERVALERIRDEFLKGLLHPDIDSKKYLSIYKQTGLLKTVFPDLSFDSPSGVPWEFSDRKDKALALAWMLQHNSIEKVAQALSPSRQVGGQDKPTGWQVDERRAILFLLKLKEFRPEQVGDYIRGREGTGLSNQQIRDWVEMFNIGGTNRNRRPWWAKQVRTFADHQRGVSWEDAQQAGKDVCPDCRGEGCPTCRNTGKLPENQRANIINSMEAEKFKQKLGH
jgi:tRNA nucleotidyltransferase/poly(A) polymerase